MNPSDRLQTTRRQFLLAGAALGVAAMQPKAGAETSLRVGLLGCGAGGAAMIESDAAGVAFVAVAGGAGSAALARKFGVAHDSVEALFARRDVDAVIVATPDRWHVVHATRALESGKHVFVLPPLTLRGEDGARLAAVARAAGRVLWVGLPGGEARRWRAVAAVESPTWIQASARVEGETAGWMSVREESWGPAARKIYDMLHGLQSHCDFGAPIGATALGGSFDGPAGGTPDALTVTVRYERGATATLSAGRHVVTEALSVRGRDGEVVVNCGDEETGFALELEEFGRVVCGGADTRMAAAVVAQEVLSGALEKWAAWA